MSKSTTPGQVQVPKTQSIYLVDGLPGLFAFPRRPGGIPALGGLSRTHFPAKIVEEAAYIRWIGTFLDHRLVNEM